MVRVTNDNSPQEIVTVGGRIICKGYQHSLSRTELYPIDPSHVNDMTFQPNNVHLHNRQQKTWSSFNIEVDSTNVTGCNIDKSIRLPAHTQMVTAVDIYQFHNTIFTQEYHSITQHTVKTLDLTNYDLDHTGFKNFYSFVPPLRIRYNINTQTDEYIHLFCA